MLILALKTLVRSCSSNRLVKGRAVAECTREWEWIRLSPLNEHDRREIDCPIIAECGRANRGGKLHWEAIQS